ncbi:MAG: multidrug efflux RND transporter permease subunit [Calditrichia bacterium]
MFSRIFIERPVTAIVISLFIISVGIISILVLPIAQLPDVTPPVVSVGGVYPGANATTVENAVATPVENQVNGTPGMMYMESTSANDGSFGLTVTFNLGTDIDVAAMDVQNRVSLATPHLPTELIRTGLSVRKRTTSMLQVIGLYSPKGTHDINFMDNYASLYIENELARVPGVGEVFTFGNTFAMRVWLDPQKMANLHLTSSDIINAINLQNNLTPGGSVGASPAPKGQTFEMNVNVKGRLVSAEEFGNIVVLSNPQTGAITRLKDIARVELGATSYSGTRLLNGVPGSGMAIYQSPGSNALTTATLVRQRMQELAKSFPEDLDWAIVLDNTRFVSASIREVLFTLGEVLLLVLFVVFLFLQTWRTTLIPLLAIPVALIGTFAVFSIIGFTINTITLFAMVLAIGIVVDDAIIVVEAAQHKVDTENLPAKEATREAMGEVGTPVIVIALILTAVFVPVAFLPGITGMLYKQFAVTIAVSVLLSAFVALTLTPALCSLLLKPNPVHADSRGLYKIFYKFNTWYDQRVEGYGNIIRKVIKKAPLMIILLLAIYGGIVLMTRITPTSFLPNEDQGMLMAVVQLPPDASTQRTQAVLQEFGTILKHNKWVERYFLVPGFSILNRASLSNFGTAFIGLKPWDERTSKDASLNAVQQQLQMATAGIKNATFIIVAPPPIPGLGTTSGFSMVITQSSGTIEELKNAQNNFLAALRGRPEIQYAYSTAIYDYPSYTLSINRDYAQKLGVSVGDIENTIQTNLGGYYVNDFTLFDRIFRVYAKADSNFRSGIDKLSQYFVRNRNGQMVPLNTLVQVQNTTSSPVISHYNMYRSVQISGNAAPGYSSGDALTALQQTASRVLPVGYNYQFTGTSLQEEEAGSAKARVFLLAIFFVFLFLAALYESWGVPFAVLLAIPIGIFGAFLALELDSLAASIYAQIGMVTIIGLAAKNAILIVEYCKMKFESGTPLIQAAVEAGKLRLRPILMTSFAFILGVVPLMLASGAGANARINIGFTVFGGMLTATMLAIFFIPFFYVMIIRLTYRKNKPGHLKVE